MTLLLQTWNPSPLHFLWPPFCTGRSRMSLGRGGGSSPTGSLIEQIKLVALAFLHPGATDQSSVLVPAVLAGACLSHFRKSKKCSRRSSQGTVCGIASVFFVAAIERREEKGEEKKLYRERKLQSLAAAWFAAAINRYAHEIATTNSVGNLLKWALEWDEHRCSRGTGKTSRSRLVKSWHETENRHPEHEHPIRVLVNFSWNDLADAIIWSELVDGLMARKSEVNHRNVGFLMGLMYFVGKSGRKHFLLAPSIAPQWYEDNLRPARSSIGLRQTSSSHKFPFFLRAINVMSIVRMRSKHSSIDSRDWSSWKRP